MRRVHTLILLLLLLLCLTAGLVIVALVSSIHTPSAALPTLFVLPTTTHTSTATRTFTPTVTATPSDTPTTTNTPTPTATLTATLTPTLAVRLIEMSAVMPGVYVPPTLTPIPDGMRVLPAPPYPFEPLPDATHEAPPYPGWYSFESDHPLVSYSTRWQARQVREASQGQYHRTENTDNFVTFPFEGEGFRVRYVAAQNMGMFDILVDGVRIDRIDAYSPDLHFPGTRVYFVGSGLHNLTLRSSGHKNESSEGMVVGLDAIQVFRGDANLLIIPPSMETATPTPIVIPERNIELVEVPPTVLPTATPLTPRQIDISVVIAYDENGNRDVDPAEGVSGISVRVVEVDNNHVITQAFTDAQGYAHLRIVTNDDTRVVVPYFGQVWDVPHGRQDGEAAFTLLLEPGNQPGLIP